MILWHPKGNNFFNNMIILKLIETKEAKHFDCGERAGAEKPSCYHIQKLRRGEKGELKQKLLQCAVHYLL